MIEFDVISELADNAELLIKSDTWLAAVEAKLSQNLTILLNELQQLRTAIQIKHRLQQSNLVAVKRPVRNGRISDEIIEILPLPKAIKLINRTDYCGQLGIWAADGYCVSEMQ